MNGELWAGLALSVLLLGYLVAALLFADRF